MKIFTTTLISLCLLGSSTALAAPTHYDVEQDEFWHGAEAVVSHQTTSPADNVSVKPYDVEQDELWHGSDKAGPPTSTTTASENMPIQHYDVEQDELWHGG